MPFKAYCLACSFTHGSVTRGGHTVHCVSNTTVRSGCCSNFHLTVADQPCLLRNVLTMTRNRRRMRLSTNGILSTLSTHNGLLLIPTMTSNINKITISSIYPTKRNFRTFFGMHERSPARRITCCTSGAPLWAIIGEYFTPITILSP